MMTRTLSKLLFTSIVTLALACAPHPAFGQHHGRGSHGGGGSHSGGSHGGGHAHSRGGGGFHSGGSRHYSGNSLRRGLSAAPRHISGGSFRRSGGPASRPSSNSAYFGSRRVGSNGPHSINGAAGRRLSTYFGRAIAAGTHASSMKFNPNRPPTATTGSRSWSGQGQSYWGTTPRSTSSFNSNRGLSNFGNSRFGHSGFGHSSFSNSRTRPRVPQFGSPRFGGARQFDWGATSFNRETSFGGDDFSFIPDLFDLALDLGGFGLRGFGLLGPGLTGFGLRGLDLLGAGLGGFSPNAGLESQQWVPGSSFYPAYPAENLTCPR
jgi:hypothetical protein